MIYKATPRFDSLFGPFSSHSASVYIELINVMESWTFILSDLLHFCSFQSSFVVFPSFYHATASAPEGLNHSNAETETMIRTPKVAKGNNKTLLSAGFKLGG